MLKTNEIISKLSSGEFNDKLSYVYSTNGDVKPYADRYLSVINGYKEIFGEPSELALFSAPGRTEIGGNHTDHQHGCVLAGSVNLDVIAAVAFNDDNVVRIKSKGYNMDEISLDDLEIHPEQFDKAISLIRGVLRAFRDRGYELKGFNAYTESNVMKGSGLSSSAAFEVLVGTIVSNLFAGNEVDAVEIAKIGQYAENVFFDKPCGLMDQMASSVGSLVHIDFNDTASPIVEKVDYDLTENGYCLCITDTKGSHADLTSDYASIPAEMKKVAALLGHEVLRPVSASDILGNIDLLRREAGDRAVLRALHFVGETRRAGQEAEALKRGDTAGFLKLVRLSGDSSFKFLQNVSPTGSVKDQQMAIGLAVSEQILGEDEPARVHGGGFAGTIQAFVRSENADAYKRTMDKTFGEGACEILSIRKYGGMRIL